MLKTNGLVVTNVGGDKGDETTAGCWNERRQRETVAGGE